MDTGHGKHRAGAPRWEDLQPGARLSIVKLSPNGAESARYSGEVVGAIEIETERWWIVQAKWTYPLVELDGLSFRPNDLLLEWFSPDRPFNAFAVFSRDAQFRGWYANVARPAYLESSDTNRGPEALVWHDLYLDLVGLPDGTYTIRDKDELDDSGLHSRNPTLYRQIVNAGEELARRFVDGKLPFLATEAMTSFPRIANHWKNQP